MLNVWLKPGAPPRDTIAIELKDGTAIGAPKFRFQVWGEDEEPDEGETKDANLVSLAFPPDWGTDRADEMSKLVRELCEVFPYRSGYAGFSFECSPNEIEESQKHAWQKSMRWRGIDIFDFAHETIAANGDGVKGVGWLTILDNGFVKELGGPKKIRAALPESVDVVQVRNGIILKAGPKPQLGDANRRNFLPEYKAVYRVIKPLAERAIDRYPPLSLDTDDPAEGTQTWLRRFDDT
jgi:hypothetical protein